MLVLFSALVLSIAPPEVALLCTEPLGELTELRFQRVGERELAPAVARFEHLAGSSVRGALLPGTRVVLATATTEPRRDESFAGSLFRLEAGRPARRLLGDVAVATRPLVARDGRVYVSRGRAGPWPANPKQGRLDELWIDEVDPRTGETRTVLRAPAASLLFLAGEVGGALLVYRVDEAGARLQALDPVTLALRTLQAPASNASRDFVVDEQDQRVLYTAANPSTRRWHVYALGLHDGALTVLADGPTMALLPTLFPDGRVGFAPRASGGLLEVSTGVELLPAFGPGFERIRFFSGDYAVGLHEVPSALAETLALRRSSGGDADGAAVAFGRVRLLAPPGVRVDVAGVLP
jgi:hypothetical protein